MRKLFNKKRPAQRSDSSYQLYDVGFHGDIYLLSLVHEIVTKYNVEYFIETGTNVGSTLTYFAKTYPNVKCLSCEPDKTAYKHAIQNTKGLKNVKIFNLSSQNFIKKLQKFNSDIFNNKTLVFLDAHSYGFEWPLKHEVSFFTKNFPSLFMLIDDFKVPNRLDFNYDKYKDQLCAHEFIKNEIQNIDYDLFYPDYIEHTSTHHPLVGWGLYVFRNKLLFSEKIKTEIKKIVRNNEL